MIPVPASSFLINQVHYNSGSTELPQMHLLVVAGRR
jgi:hypothetical protein